MSENDELFVPVGGRNIWVKQEFASQGVAGPIAKDVHDDWRDKIVTAVNNFDALKAALETIRAYRAYESPCELRKCDSCGTEVAWPEDSTELTVCLDCVIRAALAALKERK